jgi:hypothetical protein
MTGKRQRFYARNAVKTTLDIGPIRFNRTFPDRSDQHSALAYVGTLTLHVTIGFGYGRPAPERIASGIERNRKSGLKILDSSRIFLSPVHYCIAVWPD